MVRLGASLYSERPEVVWMIVCREESTQEKGGDGGKQNRALDIIVLEAHRNCFFSRMLRSAYSNYWSPQPHCAVKRHIIVINKIEECTEIIIKHKSIGRF